MQPLSGKPVEYDCTGDEMDVLEVTDSSDEDPSAVASSTTGSIATPPPSTAEEMTSEAEQRTANSDPRLRAGCVPGVFLAWTTAPAQAGCRVEVSLQVTF